MGHFLATSNSRIKDVEGLSETLTNQKPGMLHTDSITRVP